MQEQESEKKKQGKFLFSVNRKIETQLLLILNSSDMNNV